MSILSELQEACGIKRLKKDTVDSLRLRISKKVEDLSDDDWDGLSEDSQIWCNAAVKALSKNQDVPPFPDEIEDDDPEDSEDEDEVEEVKPKKKAKAKAAEKSETKTKEKKGRLKPEVAEKPETKVKEKRAKDAASKRSSGHIERSAQAGGITTVIRRIILHDPSISTADLTKELEERGYVSASKLTVSTVRGDLRKTLAIMLDEGCLSKEFEKKLR